MRILLVAFALLIFASCDEDVEYKRFVVEINYQEQPTDTLLVIAPERSIFYKVTEPGKWYDNYLKCEGVGPIAYNISSFRLIEE